MDWERTRGPRISPPRASATLPGPRFQARRLLAAAEPGVHRATPASGTNASEPTRSDVRTVRRRSTTRLDAAGERQVVRDPFPGNIVPLRPLEPVSSKILETRADRRSGVRHVVEQHSRARAPAAPFSMSRSVSSKGGSQPHDDRQRIAGLFNHDLARRATTPRAVAGKCLPDRRPTFIRMAQHTPGRMVRLSYDWTVTPTLINHIRGRLQPVRQ